MEHNPQFLKQKYDLHKSPEVEKSAKRAEAQNGEKVPQDPALRIQNYLDRLEHIILDPKKEQKRKMFENESRPRALSLLRGMIMNKYVRPNKEKMAEGAARVEERAARELGIDARYGEQELTQRGEIAVQDLEKSLDNWIAYLSDTNEPYPIWFRYYAFRNILDLGDYDKDKGEFTKRSPGTVRLFPDIDRGALAYVQDIIEASKNPEDLERLRKAEETTGTPAEQMLTKEKADNFAKLSFAKQYAEGIRQNGEITPEMREETKGKWVKYQQKTDPTALWASLQNKGAAWCTKGFATAKTQLEDGDFYVYYTLDKQGKPAIPRIAIRMQENQIFEVRGVADNQQNLEGNMADIAEKKINELPGAEKYKQVSADMKRLTNVENKIKTNQNLTKDDLIFLYEINSKIERFGYGPDPRIKELRNKRDPKLDAPVMFDCEPNEIARSQTEISDNTKAYIGPLFRGIFDQLKHIEHIYTSFPERKIRRDMVEIENKTPQEYLAELKAGGFKVYDYAKYLIEHMRDQAGGAAEQTLADKVKNMFGKGKKEIKQAEQIDLIRLTVRDLGFTGSATTDQIYEKAEEFGLELCPSEVGPQYRLQYTNQPMNEYLYIAMKQISDPDGYPNVFILEHDADGVWLRYRWAKPSYLWNPENEFVFRLPRLRK